MAVALIKGPARFGSELFSEAPLTVVQLDITTNERHTSKVDWTQHPVESGLDISDHAIEKQDEVQITGIISDTPLHTEPSRDRARIAYQDLVDLMKSKRLITLVSGLKIYQNMAITQVSTRKDRRTGQAVIPQITMRQIRIVQSLTIPVPEDILRPDLSGAGSTIGGGTIHPTVFNVVSLSTFQGATTTVVEDVDETEPSFTSASTDSLTDFIDTESLATESILGGLL